MSHYETPVTCELQLSLIDDHPENAGIYGMTEADPDLMESIRVHGQLQPVVVTPAEGGRYRAIAGHRRMAAMRALDLETVRAEERTFESPELELLALVESNRTRDKTQAHQFREASLMLQNGGAVTTIRERAEKTGIPRTTLARIEYLLTQKESTIDELKKEKLPKEALATVQQAWDNAVEQCISEPPELSISAACDAIAEAICRVQKSKARKANKGGTSTKESKLSQRDKTPRLDWWEMDGMRVALDIDAGCIAVEVGGEVFSYRPSHIHHTMRM